MTSIKVKPVTDKQGLRDFLQVPHLVHAHDRNWVAPLFLERLDHLNAQKNPYFQHAEVQLFVAYRDEKPVGRISAQDDRLRMEIHNDNMGMFGFFDAIDESSVYAALAKSAEDWLLARGRKGMLGPFSFSINDEMGQLIDGFDTPPNMMMPHGARHAPQRLEELAFRKAKDVIAYHYTFTEPSAVLQKMRKRIDANPDFSIRPINLKDMKNEIRLIRDIFNDAWSNNWGFVPWTEAELDKLGNDLKLLVNNKFGYFASYKGEASAFVVTLPNLNEYITGMNGRLLPFNWAKLALKVLRKRPNSYRMPLMGVRQKFHNTLVGSSLSSLVIDEVHRYHFSRGGKSGELSWILEDNLPTRKIIETFGGVAYKTYRIYEKKF